MRTQLTYVRANSIRPLQAATFALAITLTLSCSEADSIPPPPSGGDASKNDCIREGLEIAANTLDYITKECEATRSEVLSQLSNSVGTCKKTDLEFDKPIRDIKRDCGVDEIPIANPSSSSNGSSNAASSSSITQGSSSSVVLGSSSSIAGNSSSNGSSSSTAVQSSSSIAQSSNSSGGTSGTFTDDRDGKIYKWVKIGEQIWMAENLNYATGICYNNTANCTTYGRLYNWVKFKTACPSGWHLPSDAEWTTLIDYVGGSSMAGTKLKAKSGWNNSPGGGSGNGTDEFGFAALPGGYGSSDGHFYDVGYGGIWWSVPEYGSNYAYSRVMYYNSEIADLGLNNNSYLFSVRCLQD